jgi:hypothetical protein
MIDWITSEMNKQFFLNQYYSKLIELSVELSGEELFKNVWVSNVEYTFDTLKGIKKVKDLDDLERNLWEVRGTTPEGKQLPESMYETDELYQEIEEIRTILTKIEEEIQKKCLDYYIDYVHDYSTAEIKNFSIMK